MEATVGAGPRSKGMTDAMKERGGGALHSRERRASLALGAVTLGGWAWMSALFTRESETWGGVAQRLTVVPRWAGTRSPRSWRRADDTFPERVAPIAARPP
jgi:hypothetical protein